MIAHGRKQISEMVYARKASEGGGAVRLTNMIRGGSVVFGNLRPSFKWLTNATKAAILAAFGQTDGKAVIKATNRYLNGIAASDRDKATALAGFINEDPMMVCSLGLSVEGVTMPIRGIKSATINSNTALETNYAIQSTGFKLKAYLIMNNTEWVALWGNGRNWNQQGSFTASYLSGNKTQWWCNASRSSNWSGTSINKVVDRWIWFEQNYNGIVQDGTTTSLACNIIPPDTIKIWCCSGQLTKEWIFEDNSGTIVRHYVPSRQNGVNGLVDLVTCQFVAPYIGSLTIPDIVYTPLNQQ